MSKNIPRSIRIACAIGLTRARPDSTYHAMIAVPIEKASTVPAAMPGMPNRGTGPRPRPRTAPNTIWHTAVFRVTIDGNFMLPVPRKMEAKVFISHGTNAAPKKICM